MKHYIKNKQIYGIIIKNIIEEILTNNGIQYKESNGIILLSDKTLKGTNVTIEVGAVCLYLEGDIHNVTLYTTNSTTKKVQLIYNNQKDYNSNDEKYVRNLKIESPKYFGMDIALFNSSQTWDKIFELIGNYYTNLINDDSIVVVATAGAGGGDYISTGTAESGTCIGIFKNEILYDIRTMGCEHIIPLINVPANIKESEMNDFLISEINRYFPEESKYIVRIEKGARTYDGTSVDNGYTVYFNYNGIESGDCAIVRRETEKEPININSQDNKTNIKLETDTSVVPEDTTLVVEKITTGDSYNTVVATLGDTIDKFVLYDITLKSNGVEIQPNGKVKISIPIPEGFSKDKLVVYRISDNEKIKYDVKVETVDGKDYATFETDHFSLYTLALDNGTTNTPDNSTNNNTLDETPKTGNIDISLYFISAVVVVALVGIILVKKKNK